MIFCLILSKKLVPGHDSKFCTGTHLPILSRYTSVPVQNIRLGTGTNLYQATVCKRYNGATSYRYKKSNWYTGTICTGTENVIEYRYKFVPVLNHIFCTGTSSTRYTVEESSTGTHLYRYNF